MYKYNVNTGLKYIYDYVFINVGNFKKYKTESCTHSMAHAKLVWYMVTMWKQLIHVLYVQEHASRARRKYIPGIVFGRVGEPETKHLGGRGNYNNTPSKTITIKLQIINMLQNGPTLLTSFDDWKLDCIGVVHCHPW